MRDPSRANRVPQGLRDVMLAHDLVERLRPKAACQYGVVRRLFGHERACVEGNSPASVLGRAFGSELAPRDYGKSRLPVRRPGLVGGSETLSPRAPGTD